VDFPLSDTERDRLFESLPERQKRLLRLVADGLADAEIAGRVGEPEQMITMEIQGVFTELGLRTRTHAIVYLLARDLSATSRGPKPRAPIAREFPDDRHGVPTEGTQEAG
jgi:DNA-binding NarL/FixJ family response regulator